MLLSFIIPIYNRPDELEELLWSISALKPVPQLQYEVIVVEDGSTVPAVSVCERFKEQIPLTYLSQSNTGPSGARNYGASQARGEWLIFLDSDTILPEGYLLGVAKGMAEHQTDLWGGPDRAREDFTSLQKGINYSVTSVLTTGGIRGGKDGAVDKFYPRTFNMGVRKEAFLTVGGFNTALRYGEDLDFSMRVLKQGYKSALFSEAWLYHKRRGNFHDFFKQIRHSGRARVVLNRLHPGTMRLVHYLPVAFVLYHIFMLFGIAWGAHVIPLVYVLLILFDAYIKEGSMDVAVHALVATYVQFFAYAIGTTEEIFNKVKREA